MMTVSLPNYLNTPVMALSGVGPKTQKLLEKCGLETIADILFHFPFRYEDRTRVVPLAAVHHGDTVQVEGRVDNVFTKGKQTHFIVVLRDETATLRLRFFHHTRWMREKLSKPNQRLRCYGEIRRIGDHYEMMHPECQYLLDTEQGKSHVPKRLTAVYSTVEKLSQTTLRQLVAQAMAPLRTHPIHDWLLESLRLTYHFPDWITALETIHFPPKSASEAELLAFQHPAQQRFIFEELLAHQLMMQQIRQASQSLPAPALPEIIAGSTQKLLARLPFTLTTDQQKVASEIAKDLSTHRAMQRLVQGDVGSGKTVIACLAALQAIDNGYQCALMAPTEILAEQHYLNWREQFTSLGMEVVLLQGKTKASDRKAILAKIRIGEAQLIIGTHALFQASVIFHKLGLVIIDEQHRFGVHQRYALREKGEHAALSPHQLIMTATPIPRTLAMSAYADMDHSVIRTLPPGRQPTQTAVIPATRREEIIERIRQVCQHGQQGYWVCPLIEQSEKLSAEAAEKTAERLHQLLPEIRIGLIHGKMPSAAKQAIMSAFSAHRIDLLVATTVIEVGVDVPNASLMIIENPERMGLAQLHQLRGRVGRGTEKSHCVLLYQLPLSDRARDRLAALRKSHDGFYLSEEDLRLRGPGDIVGTRQSGLLDLSIADLSRDTDWLVKAKVAAQTMREKYPDRIAPLLSIWMRNRERYVGV